MSKCPLCCQMPPSVCNRCIAKNIRTFRERYTAAVRSTGTHTKKVCALLDSYASKAQELAGRLRNIQAELEYIRSISATAKRQLESLQDLTVRRKTNLDRLRISTQKGHQQSLNKLRVHTKGQRKARKDICERIDQNKCKLVQRLYSAYRIPQGHVDASLVLKIGAYQVPYHQLKIAIHHQSAMLLLANFQVLLSRYLSLDLRRPIRFFAFQDATVLDPDILKSNIEIHYSPDQSRLSLGELATLLYTNLYQIVQEYYTSSGGDPGILQSIHGLLASILQHCGTIVQRQNQIERKESTMYSVSEGEGHVLLRVRERMTELLETDTFEMVEH